MYLLKSGGLFTIYDPRVDELVVREPVVNLAVNGPGSMSFIIDADHPNISHLNKLIDTLELTNDGEVIFRGRVIRDSKDFNNSRTIEVEGLLGCLNDSAIPPFDYPGDFQYDARYIQASMVGNVVEYFLTWLLEQHNAQVTTAQQIKLGTVTVSDPNNYIARSSDSYTTTWEIVSKLPESKLGGILMVRYESDGTYLDYLADYPSTNAQKVEFGENLLDLVTDVDASEMYSAILPIGAEGLSVASLPDATLSSDCVKQGAIIFSVSKRSSYGNITAIMSWDDVTSQARLQAKALAALNSAGLSQTITVSACDLHYADATIPSLKVGAYTQLVSAPHGYSLTYPLTAISIYLADPAQTEITFGETQITASDINAEILRNRRR